MSNFNLFGEDIEVLRKPFLRWTGGKNWLSSDLSKIISNIEFNNYHEPFLGGGSIFFSLNTNKKAFLSDFKADLINTYLQVRNKPTEVIGQLKDFPQSSDFYYELRDSISDSEIFQAARFIFLNKTSFNGIYRVNSHGKYNVPYGKKSFDIHSLSELILSCSKQLQNAEIASQDFKYFIVNVQENDLIYLDPPYTISHNNNGFIKYNEKLFSINDQLKLSEIIGEIRDRKAYYILSNAHHPDVKAIYDKYGDRVLSFKRRSSVSGNISGREKYKEYLFTNIVKL